MGTASFVLVGTAGSMAQTFGSTCHGRGRVMSRAQASVKCAAKNSRVNWNTRASLSALGPCPAWPRERLPAYKDVDRVVEVVHRAGIARKVARLEPFAVIKG